ncbi:PLC-like phosphodiesterase [Panus rudis PR-1116 ss-1]|nr:PLC-like phosphodiesterase [Panus rudis PR-1116 ss-1]
MFLSTALTQVVLSLLLSTTYLQSTASAAYLQRRATTCNGHAELCDRSYGNITFVGAHNSYAVGTNNLATNQDYDVSQQLKDGIRLLQMQAHNQNGVIQLCHSLCSLYNGGTLQDYLGKVKSFMDANPNEVVTLLIVNSDNLPPSQFDTVFKAAGLDTMSFTPESATLTQSAWPTLGSMIDSGKRLVTFLSTTADFTAVPYLIDEFTNVWETAFDVTDPTFDCNVNRTKGDPTTQLYLINHFLDEPLGSSILSGIPVPNKDQANVTNSASGPGSLGEQVATCVNDHGRSPNFLLVDFYEFGGGSIFQVAADANGVTYNPSTPIATPLDNSSASSPTGSGSSSSSSAAVDFRIGMVQVYAVMGVVSCLLLGGLSVL